MSDVYGTIWMSFNEFNEDIYVMLTFYGRLVSYPHEGMNDTTVTLYDVEDIECIELMIEGGQPGDVKDYINVFGEEAVHDLIDRAERQVEFETS